ncbi:MAG: hypothetical protein VYE54_01765 [Pseudomonadota bacterium]|nr:hypothetical protein [Pseudomonadota bacterium]
MATNLPDGLYQARGQGANQVQAIDQALSTIARQVRVAIRAEAQSTQSKRDGTVSQQFEKRISSESEQVFDDYRLVCADPVNQTVVVEYDHRALSTRLRDRLGTWWGQEGWQLIWATGLAPSSDLKLVVHQSGLSPISVAVTLLRDRNGWYLQLNERRMNLREGEWRAFYAPPVAQPSGLSLELVNEHAQLLSHSVGPGTEFRFSIRGLTDSHRYLSVFALDGQGRVTVVRSNVPVEGSTIEIPDAPGIFSAELPAGSTESIDDYWVLLSAQPQTLPQSFWYFEGWHLLVDQYERAGLRVVVR